MDFSVFDTEVTGFHVTAFSAGRRLLQIEKSRAGTVFAEQKISVQVFLIRFVFFHQFVVIIRSSRERDRLFRQETCRAENAVRTRFPDVGTVEILIQIAARSPVENGKHFRADCISDGNCGETGVNDVFPQVFGFGNLLPHGDCNFHVFGVPERLRHLFRRNIGDCPGNRRVHPRRIHRDECEVGVRFRRICEFHALRILQ